MEKFEKWVKSSKSNIKNAKAVNLSNFGKSLVASTKILKNEIILSIDKSLFISMETVYKDKFISSIIQIHKLNISNKSLMGLFLWKEICEKENSFWYAYFNILPKRYSNIVTWNSFELLNIQRPDLIQKIKLKQNIYNNEYEKIKDVINLFPENSYNDFLRKLNFEKFINLIGLIESRTLFFENEFDRKSEVGVLVPYYDLCNHKFLDNCDAFENFYYDKNIKKYILKAYKDFEENEQIFINYGNYNNFHFIEYYGFLPLDNLFNDYLVISLDFEEFINENKEISKIIKNLWEYKIKLIYKFFPNLCIKYGKNEIMLNKILEIELVNIEKTTFLRWQEEILFKILTINQHNNKIINDINDLYELTIENSENYLIIIQELKKYLVKKYFNVGSFNELNNLMTSNLKLSQDYRDYELKIIQNF